MPAMLDVRVLARQLRGITPIELVHVMQDDGVPLVMLSAKRWRVAEPDCIEWLERCKAKSAEMARERRFRLRHVAGKTTTTTTNRKPKFRR